MKFVFRSAAEIHFGPGEAKRLREHAARLGKRPFVVSGSRGFEGLDGPSVRVSGEPDVAGVDAAVRICREERCDVVVGVGGGSVLDTAKAVAGMAANPGSVAEYLEDVGTKTLAAAWAKDGIRVNAVAPGLTRSNMTARIQELPELVRADFARMPL